MSHSFFLHGQTDVFVGKHRPVDRYLVVSMAGQFPVLSRTGPNSLACTYRVGAPHVGISGTVGVSVSHDGGKSWDGPVEVNPRGEDARNPAIGVNAAGEIVLAVWKAKYHVFKEDANGWHEVGPWRSKEELGRIPSIHVTRSADDGKTWTEPVSFTSRILAYCSPYGRIVTAPDGTLLMGAQGLPRDGGSQVPELTPDLLAGNPSDAAILIRSRDGGKTWGDETLTGVGYNETAYAFLPDGTLLAAARTHDSRMEILSSRDAGRTWSKPADVTRGGLCPGDLTVLQDGKLLLTFGRRVIPLGCGALLSGDGGRTWNYNREIILAADGGSCPDLGYPSTVQLDDGHIVTVLYYAGGSQMASDHYFGWGELSCQAIHYHLEDIE